MLSYLLTNFKLQFWKTICVFNYFYDINEIYLVMAKLRIGAVGSNYDHIPWNI